MSESSSSDGYHRFRLELEQNRDVGEEVFRAVTAQGWPLRELRRDDKTLERVFRELTEAGAAEVRA